MRWWWSKAEGEGEDIGDGGAQAASAASVRLIPLVLILQQSRLCMMAMRAGGGLAAEAPSMSHGDQSSRSETDRGPGVGDGEDDVSPLLRGLRYTGSASRPSLLYPHCSHHCLCSMAAPTASVPPSLLLAFPYFPHPSISSVAPLTSSDVRCQCDWLRCTTWCIRTFLSTAISSSSSSTVTSQTTTVSTNTRAVIDLLQLLSMLLRDCPSTPLPADMYELLRTAVHATASTATTTCLRPKAETNSSDEMIALCCLIESHLLPLHSPRRSASLLHHPTTMTHAEACQSFVLPPSSPCACISKVNMWPGLVHTSTAPYDVIWLPALHRSFSVLLLSHSPANGYHDYQCCCCCCCEFAPSAMTTALLCLSLVDPPYLYLSSSRGTSNHPTSSRQHFSNLSPSFTLSAKQRLAVFQEFFDMTLQHLLRYLPPGTPTTAAAAGAGDSYDRSDHSPQRDVEGDDGAERSSPLPPYQLPSGSENTNSRKRARVETRDATATATMLVWFCVWARRLCLLSHQLAPLPLPRRTALASLLLRLQHLGNTTPRSAERASVAGGVAEQTIDQHSSSSSSGASLLPQLLLLLSGAAHKWVLCVVRGNAETAPREIEMRER